MALLAESKGFNAPDEDDTDTVTLTSSVWGSEAPKTHLMFGMGNSAATVNTSMKNSIGWSDASDQVAIGNGSENGQGTSICNRTHQTAYVTHPLSNNGGTYERAVQSSYSASTPRIAHTWSSSAEDGYHYWLMALGGDDVENISIDVISTKSGSTGDVSYTGPGFEPDFLLAFSSAGHTSGLPYSAVHSVQGFGFSDGTTDACNYNASLDAQSTSNTYCVHSANFLHITGSTGSDTVTATVKSLDSSGYTLTYGDVHASVGFYYTIIAIKGPAAKVVTTTQPASNTTNDLDAGFVPKAGICLGAMKTASQTSTSNNRFTIGTWDEQDNMDSGGWMDEHGQSTTDVDRYISNAYSIVNYNHAQTVVGRATVAAQGNGIRETWTSTDGTQYAHSWLLLGDTPSETATTNDAFLLFLDSL